MRSRYKAVLNGVSLTEISPKIAIRDISYSPAEIRRTTSSLANRSGAMVAGEDQYNGARCEITVEIHEYSTIKRQELCQAIIAWAVNGGVLEINDRPDQMLVCRCDDLPSISSVQEWTEYITMSFSGYESPCWQDIHPAVLALSGTSGSGYLAVPGVGIKTFAEVEIVPQSTITSITITVEDTSITLAGLVMASGEKIRIWYDRGIQKIRIIHADNSETSILNKRTATSSDDLVVTSGKRNAVAFSASAVANVKISARGVWL